MHRFLLLALLAVAASSVSVASREEAGTQLLGPSSSGVIRNHQATFSVSLVPTAPVPIRIGTRLGLRLSSSTAGYASLYLIDPVHAVQVLAENLPLAAGSMEYPAQGFTLVAEQPLGFNFVILLVTRQPFGGFSGDATLTRPVSLALSPGAFVSQLNRAAGALPSGSWAMDEIRIRIVG